VPAPSTLNSQEFRLSEPHVGTSGPVPRRWWVSLGVLLMLASVISVLSGQPAVGRPDAAAMRAVDIGILVFREGLECLLVLLAITANMTGERRVYREPVAAGVMVGVAASLFTWHLAVGVIDDLTTVMPALDVQVVTGLLAIVVLLVVMNWFFHKIYWTGWISLHTQKRQALMASDGMGMRMWWGMALLGLSSLYREGVEIVLFLQSYRLRVGSGPVTTGVLVGLGLTAGVGVIAFWLQRRLPYKRMLVVTGAILGVVLLVMVGEQAQEMQLARWIPTTEIPFLRVPDWAQLWFAVFPTVETLVAQVIAAVLVLGSYIIASRPARAR